MLILGRGFLARNLAPLQSRYPDVLAFARGVANTGCVDPLEFEREATALNQAIRQCRHQGLRLVYFSTASASIYGAAGCAGREDEPVAPTSAYGRHKLALERAALSAGVEALVLRTTHLVGADQPPRNILPGLVSQLLTGEVQVYVGACRDLLDVADLRVLLDALLRREATGRVNMASGYPVEITQLVDALEAHLGTRARRVLVRTATPSVARPDVSRLHALAPVAGRLGFGPDYYLELLRRYLPGPVAPPAALLDTPIAG